MPKKAKEYKRVKFTPGVIKEAENKFLSFLDKKGKTLSTKILFIHFNEEEEWNYDSEEIFFANYIKGFQSAGYSKHFRGGEFDLWIHGSETKVTIELANEQDVESVFNFFEAKKDKYTLPKEPGKTSKAKTDWVAVIVNKINSFHPVTGRKLKLALNKLESEDTEEWQNAAMLIRDAWIELSQHLCFVNQINTSDVGKDAVVERFRKLGIEKGDVKLFNLARDTFNLSNKHHSRELDHYSAVACVISSIVSMQTIIQESFHA